MRAQRVALHFLRAGGGVTELGCAGLKRRAYAFARALRGLGIGTGDRACVLAGRLPVLDVSVLGALKNGSVVTPLFSAFGPEAIATRSNVSAARVPVTTEAPYRRKVERMRDKECATP